MLLWGSFVSGLRGEHKSEQWDHRGIFVTGPFVMIAVRCDDEIVRHHGGDCIWLCFRVKHWVRNSKESGVKPGETRVGCLLTSKPWNHLRNCHISSKKWFPVYLPGLWCFRLKDGKRTTSFGFAFMFDCVSLRTELFFVPGWHFGKLGKPALSDSTVKGQSGHGQVHLWLLVRF